MTRSSTAKSRILKRLQSGAATTAQLCQPDCGGVRFSARIEELRKDGHNITTDRIRAGSCLYTLVGVPPSPDRAVQTGERTVASGADNPPAPLASIFEPAPSRPLWMDFDEEWAA